MRSRFPSGDAGPLPPRSVWFVFPGQNRRYSRVVRISEPVLIASHGESGLSPIGHAVSPLTCVFQQAKIRACSALELELVRGAGIQPATSRASLCPSALSLSYPPVVDPPGIEPGSSEPSVTMIHARLIYPFYRLGYCRRAKRFIASPPPSGLRPETFAVHLLPLPPGFCF